MPCHQTLRAVVDWRRELLSETHRTLVRKLAVFLGETILKIAKRIGGPGFTATE
jgi:predicted ATPase